MKLKSGTGLASGYRSLLHTRCRTIAVEPGAHGPLANEACGYRSQGGLGIGLTLVKRLVELHGGTIEAYSEGQGQGSEFRVCLPVRVSEPIARQVAASSSPQARVVSRRVLVVDDNEDAARTLAILLQGQGHQICLAHDGPSALEKAAEFDPQCVVLDIGLPGMTGYEVARKMRQQPGCQNTVLIAVTGYGQEEDRSRSRDAGIDHHFVKPVDIAKLSRVLDSAHRGVAGK